MHGGAEKHERTTTNDQRPTTNDRRPTTDDRRQIACMVCAGRRTFEQLDQVFLGGHLREQQGAEGADGVDGKHEQDCFDQRFLR